jgi:hypothetical protein
VSLFNKFYGSLVVVAMVMIVFCLGGRTEYELAKSRQPVMDHDRSQAELQWIGDCVMSTELETAECVVKANDLYKLGYFKVAESLPGIIQQ